MRLPPAVSPVRAGSLRCRGADTRQPTGRTVGRVPCRVARAPARRRALGSPLDGPDGPTGGFPRRHPDSYRRPGDASVSARKLGGIRRYGHGRGGRTHLRRARRDPRAVVRFAPTEPATGRQGTRYEFQCAKRGTREGQMKKSALSYSVTRRRFLRDATLTSLGIVAAACTPGGTSPKWSDGSAFTSKDVVATFNAGRMDSFTIWNYINKVEADGDLGVKFTYKTPSSLGERNILRVSIRPASIYGTIADRAAALYASGKDNTSAEIVALRAEKENLRPDPMSVGPYMIDKNSVTEAQLTMTRNANGLFGNSVNFDKVIIYQGETAQVTPLVLAGDVDYATHGFPLATDKAFVDAGIRVIRGPGYTGPAIYFHWEKAAAFQDKRLRQAVAMAINKDESAKVTYGDSAKTQKYMAGFSDNLVPQWLSSADLGKLNAYAYDVTKAAGLMTAAGYAKGSDGIYAKDGKKLEFEMYSPSDFADWSSAADHAQKSLNTFGIKIVPRGAISSQQLPDVNNGNFQIAIRAWGTGNPHPQGSFIQDLRTHNTTAAAGGMKYPLKQGNTDFDALINKMGDGFDTTAQKAPVTEAALAFNDLLPVVPLWERYGNNPVNDKKRVTGWKPDSDPIYKNPWSVDAFTTYLIMDGTLRKI
ncbi:MAG: ABC transporter substrate-binding protein [Chloroflexi bacterium]|nr:MAG: ABC transporter substrate-binding protein [Chloroflexota bacterium]